MARGMNWERSQTQRTEPADAAWWWTPARVGTCCAECSEWTPKGSLVAYNHRLRAVVCELCGEKYAPQTSYAASVRKSAKPTAARAPGKSEPRRYRTLQTRSGPVRYADSGWSEREWAVIRQAMSRRA